MTNLKSRTNFKPNRPFRRKYRKLFNLDPVQANLFLLMCELADENGQVVVTDEREIAELIAARFEDPTEWAL